MAWQTLRHQQIEAFCAPENGWLVVTVLVKYFQENGHETDLRSEVQHRVHLPAGQGAQVEPIRLSLAPDGAVYGIELLNANAQLAAGNGGELIVVNEASGESSRIKLPA